MAVLKAPHWETVSPTMRELLRWTGAQEFSQPFYLAGGTALALQLGHRISVDLDFFSETDEVHTQTRQKVISAFVAQNGQVIENVDGNLLLLVNGIHVGFFSYGYPLLEPSHQLENIALASTLDIGLMKLDAVIGRGGRKDFIDVYNIVQELSLGELFAAAEKKYPQVRDFPLMAAEALVNFENADRDVQPSMLIELDWQGVREYFLEQVKSFGNDWFGPHPLN